MNKIEFYPELNKVVLNGKEVRLTIKQNNCLLTIFNRTIKEVLRIKKYSNSDLELTPNGNLKYNAKRKA
jgi:hypothetical protein